MLDDNIRESIALVFCVLTFSNLKQRNNAQHRKHAQEIFVNAEMNEKASKLLDSESICKIKYILYCVLRPNPNLYMLMFKVWGEIT